MKKLILLLSLLMGACATKPSYKVENPEYWYMSNRSVKLLDSTLMTGGSGVIWNSSKDGSLIITNAHVCEKSEIEGMKILTKERVVASGRFYKMSKKYDLCVVATFVDLKYSTPIAKRTTKMFDKTYVSGYPENGPIIITEGHASSLVRSKDQVGFEDCSFYESLNDEDCMKTGKKKKYKIEIIRGLSNIVAPGSSGSGVFNSDLDLSAIVCSYDPIAKNAFAVPYEHLLDFLIKELPTLPAILIQQ